MHPLRRARVRAGGGRRGLGSYFFWVSQQMHYLFRLKVPALR
jgi:hypothetical protein